MVPIIFIAVFKLIWTKRINLHVALHWFTLTVCKTTPPNRPHILNHRRRSFRSYVKPLFVVETDYLHYYALFVALCGQSVVQVAHFIYFSRKCLGRVRWKEQRCLSKENRYLMRSDKDSVISVYRALGSTAIFEVFVSFAGSETASAAPDHRPSRKTFFFLPSKRPPDGTDIILERDASVLGSPPWENHTRIWY